MDRPLIPEAFQGVAGRSCHVRFDGSCVMRATCKRPAQYDPGGALVLVNLRPRSRQNRNLAIPVLPHLSTRRNRLRNGGRRCAPMPTSRHSDAAAAALYMRAVRWVMRYCTWEGLNDSLPRPHCGKISPLAFNMLLGAMFQADIDGMLPTLRVKADTFAHFVGGKRRKQAAIDELVRARLIAVVGATWTFCIDEDLTGESRP
jgi:hypothetical protein